MKYKKYNKLVNTTTTKKSLLTDIDNKLVVTNGRGKQGNGNKVELEVQSSRYKISYKLYCTTRAVLPIFYNNYN